MRSTTIGDKIAVIRRCQNLRIEPGNAGRFNQATLNARGVRWRVFLDDEELREDAHPFSAYDDLIELAEEGSWTCVRRTDEVVLWKPAWARASIYGHVLSECDCIIFPLEQYQSA